MDKQEEKNPELVLVPHETPVKDELQIKSFPFIVGRQVPIIRKLALAGDEARTAVSKASRKHAEITWRDGHFYVKDLGSLNGTFYDQRRIETNEEIQLSDGARLGFSEWLTFLVQIPNDVTKIPPNPNRLVASGIEDGLGLDDDDMEATAPEDVFRKALEGEDIEPLSTMLKPAAMPPKRPKEKWSTSPAPIAKKGPSLLLIIGITAVCAAGLLIWALTNGGTSTTTLKDLIAQGEYRKALTASTPKVTAEDTQLLLRQAAAGYLMKTSGWPAALQNQDFATAERIIAEIESLANQDEDITSICAYARYLSQTIEAGERLEQTGTIVVGVEEVVIQKILQKRKAYAPKFSNAAIVLKQFGEQAAAIAETARKVETRFEKLEQTLLPRITELLDTTEAKLSMNNPGPLRETYRQFDETYSSDFQPVKIDITHLHQDLTRYIRLQNAITGQQVFDITGVSIQKFATPVFRKHAERVLKKAPPVTELAKYAEARTLWKLGKSEQAIGILGDLKLGTWSEVAEELGYKYTLKQVAISELSKLSEVRTPAEAEKVLKAFKDQLDTDDDTVYRKRFEKLHKDATRIATEAAGK